MKKLTFKPVAAAAVLALAAPAYAAGLDFSGSNIYMKFLDGDQRKVSLDSGDTASGSDNGQWTEFELRIKATISKQVEAGVRIQSRSPAAYWTDFGFADENTPVRAKFMKLRGAYVLLTPGYKWLDQALIGSSDWGMFDPFTVGQVRYIDRDNYNGLYFKGPLLGGGSWEAGRVSLPSYLQTNWGNSKTPNPGGLQDDTKYSEGVYIGQIRKRLGPVGMTASYQFYNDKERDFTDSNSLDGIDTKTLAKHRVLMLKAEGSVMDGVDLKGAYYHSSFKQPLFNEPWGNAPKSNINDRAFKIDLGLSSLPVPGLTVNLQYFNIGAGYFSNLAARRESDVLLTEGSEAVWYRFGDPLWYGGAATNYQQSPANNKLVDNGFIDFDEAPNESVVGWKGLTMVAGYEIAKTPMSLELTRIGYNNNWTNYGATAPLSNFFSSDQDRKTDIAVFKVSHVLPLAGGIEAGFKYKRVKDRDNRVPITPYDPTDGFTTSRLTDDGYTFSVGNQLFGDLFGSLSWGHYTRKGAIGENFPTAVAGEIKKNITSVRLNYNLAGFETGLLVQHIDGSASGKVGGFTGGTDFKQYRLKATVKAIF